ncbi:MAG: radical SAM protein [Chloroflexi bacterium]|nr:radical SAM protein [Chloroflexota bacterium]
MPSPIEIIRRQLTLTTHRIHTLPVVILMPHSRCNCRCVMCDIWKANHNKQEISREDLSRHLETFKKFNVRWVVMSGGEALMHSNLWTLCDLLKGMGIKITLLSTGLLLKPHTSNILRWCDEVIVSLDGSREVHDIIRNVPRAYDRLAEGVASLKAIDPRFRVTARSVIQRRNFADLPHTIDAAHTIGLDQISFLAADIASTAFNRPAPWGDERVTDVALSPNEVIQFRDILEQVIVSHSGDFTSGFVAESPAKLRRLPQYFSALNGEGDFPETTCNAPWVSTVIEADGTVRPCFFHRPLGNIHEHALDEILNSADAITFRHELDVRRDAICRKCVCTLHMGLRADI